MTEGLNYGIAFVAGVLSFLSPCVLPLIPSYVSLIGGTSIQQLQENTIPRWRAFSNTVFFVIGFSAVFIVLGIFLTSTLGLLGNLMRTVNLIAGAVVIVLGLNVILDFWKMLNIERRFHLTGKPAGAFGSLLFGMAFGAGWSPCVGPILGSILILAGTSGTFLRGLKMLSLYSLGLGFPFLLTGLFFSVAVRQIQRIRPHLRTIRIVSGVFLVGIGGLILAGGLQRFNSVLFRAAYGLELFEQASPWAARSLFGGLFLLVTGALIYSYVRLLRHGPQGEGATPDGAALEGSSPRAFRPVRLAFILLFAVIAVLSFSGVISVSRMLSSWFSFQGI